MEKSLQQVLETGGRLYSPREMTGLGFRALGLSQSNRKERTGALGPRRPGQTVSLCIQKHDGHIFPGRHSLLGSHTSSFLVGSGHTMASPDSHRV